MAEFVDEVSRACERNGIIAGSQLERDLRLNIFNIAGADMSAERDQKLDKWIGEQRRDPAYASSLKASAPRPKPKEQTIDLLNLTPTQFDEIAATGKVHLG